MSQKKGFAAFWRGRGMSLEGGDKRITHVVKTSNSFKQSILGEKTLKCHHQFGFSVPRLQTSLQKNALPKIWPSLLLSVGNRGIFVGREASLPF